MDVSEIKEKIQDLVTKLGTINEDDYDKNKLYNEFIKPFFETLGWDFQTDVKIPNSITENKADYAFQIDGVSRFYLNILPPSASLEDRKQILSLTTFAYNKGVTWAIQTNFKELRVYNTEAPGTTPASMQHYAFLASEYVSEYEKLLDLTKKQFSLNVLDSDAEFFGKKPKRVPIDQQLLKDLLSYRNIIANEIKNNNSVPEEQAEEYAQKILNRLIFIRSCGDRQIEERHLKSMLGDWNDNKNKKLIEHLQGIFAYFRGRYGSSLFEKHACDNSIIRDHILEEIIEGLYKSKEKSLSYDFSLITSDVLGKMYENYLGTIQQKQDGAYYTPNYISKYIAENTIIPYLSKSDVTTIPDLITEYADNIEELESKIHNIKILDPACGTGEFLIRAIDVLLKISKGIQTQKEKTGQYLHTGKKKKSESVTYATFDKDIENQQLRTIIQNNIHGVDINEEAIEITQLNMFLKLATSSQQLIDISKNLRVGNALVDDPAVDPKAFDWEKVFPEKFDVVIGNPPYVFTRGNNFTKPEKNYFKNKIDSLGLKQSKKGKNIQSGKLNLYSLFLLQCIPYLRNNAKLGFIVPNNILRTTTYDTVRKFILDTCRIKLIIDLSAGIFQNVTASTIMIILENESVLVKRTNNKTKVFHKVKDLISNYESHIINQNSFYENTSYTFNILQNTQNEKIFLKINKNSIKFGDICQYIIEGIVGKKNRDLFNKKINENYKPFLDGKDIGPYIINYKNEFIRYDRKILHRARPENVFLSEKILVQRISGGKKPLRAALDRNKFYTFASINNIILKDSNEYSLEYITALLNSNLINWYYGINFSNNSKLTVNISKTYLEQIPIKNITKNEQKKISELVNTIMKIDKNEDTKTYEKIEIEINEIIYSLYNITDEEKAIIESSI